MKYGVNSNAHDELGGRYTGIYWKQCVPLRLDKLYLLSFSLVHYASCYYRHRRLLMGIVDTLYRPYR